ncbi:carbohydrate ABC transporter permease [Lachnotalea sp. AF33-28]|jgi:N-acetylglucosamine transport system permease protein|uniref:carbohydrate ABC transporter permease n=1 Tax=Lachnotalea sp. AF33-28 TaxID=2292046 RepID=UPI000E4B6090|nr:carbohydrate ABC transporter permease [Lachnotalea sp. AF33-28]RHP36328.1 carbohydrate ABC transporter permease [Lachnotalea sp. AF33-28]
MSKEAKRKIVRILLRVLLFVAVILVILPLVWTFISSLKDNNEISQYPLALPAVLQWNNFARAWTNADIGANFMNSIFVTALSMALSLLMVVPASYALGRYSGKVLNPIRALLMAGMFIQKNYLVVPLFMLLLNFGMLNSRIAMCVVYACTTLPFYIFLMSGFMEGVDNAYVEAANIDGAGHFRTMVSVVFPMCKPGVATMLMFSFMEYWNEYILALQFLRDDSKKTLPVGLKNLMEQAKYATDWGALFAAMVIVMIPTMIFYLLVQKKLTSGLSLGGLKG